MLYSLDSRGLRPLEGLGRAVVVDGFEFEDDYKATQTQEFYNRKVAQGRAMGLNPLQVDIFRQGGWVWDSGLCAREMNATIQGDHPGGIPTNPDGTAAISPEELKARQEAYARCMASANRFRPESVAALIRSYAGYDAEAVRKVATASPEMIAQAAANAAAGGSSSSAAAKGVSISPAKTAFTVGESWTLTITGKPNAAVQVYGGQNNNYATADFGSTDASGRRVLTGSFGSGEAGSWYERWSVGGEVVGELRFTVGPASSSAPSPAETTPGSGPGATPERLADQAIAYARSAAEGFSPLAIAGIIAGVGVVGFMMFKK